MMKRLLACTLAALLVLSLTGCFSRTVSGPKKVGEVSSESEETPAESAAPQEEKTVFGVGEKVELNNVVVTLLGVEESDGATFFEPDKGNVFVLCEFEIENNSKKEISVSSLLSFDCYCDDYATNYSFSAQMANEDKGQLDGTVASGKKMNGVIGYEVPGDWKELEIRFTPRFWSRDDITFVAYHE